MSWELDKAHSQITFSAKHMMVTTVRGSFKDFSGIFEIEEDHPEKSDIEVTIQAASLDTGAEQRDAHLRSPDFFDVEKYPTITFKSTRIEKKNDEHFTVYGDLTVRGQTHEVPLEVTFEGETKNMQGQRLGAFTARTSISRKQWGLEWNVALESGGWLVSDKINIEIDTQVVEPATAPAEAANA